MPQAAKADSITVPERHLQTIASTSNGIVALYKVEGRLRGLAALIGAYLDGCGESYTSSHVKGLIEGEANEVAEAAGTLRARIASVETLTLEPSVGPFSPSNRNLLAEIKSLYPFNYAKDNHRHSTCTETHRMVVDALDDLRQPYSMSKSDFVQLILLDFCVRSGRLDINMVKERRAQVEAEHKLLKAESDREFAERRRAHLEREAAEKLTGGQTDAQ